MFKQHARRFELASMVLMVLGIVALVLSWIPIINNVAAIVALVGLGLGIPGLILARRGTHRGQGPAITGLVTSVLAIAVVVLTQILFVKAVDEARQGFDEAIANAEADQVDPLYSRILLANENGKQNFLEAHEILGIPMRSTALVTLSACESGLGRIAKGDEVLGFTRSFLSAGTSALIASLWPVSDDATEVLMSTVYAELSRGRDVQRAMQAGQLAVLKQPRMAHPFFWAPFNVIGNGRLLIAATSEAAR